MAIYHLHCEAIKRTARSAVAASAYRSGTMLTDERSGAIYDFRPKGRNVAHADTFLPGGGTARRAWMWNRIEAHHKRGDSTTAREIEVALPRELSGEQRQTLAREFARGLADKYGVFVDLAVHRPGGTTENHHAHILMSACACDARGNLGKKVIELDQTACRFAKVPNTAERERPVWEAMVNKALAEAGADARVCHKTLAAQGIVRAPGIHRGPAATAFEKRMKQKSRLRLTEEKHRAGFESELEAFMQSNPGYELAAQTAANFVDYAVNSERKAVFAHAENLQSKNEERRALLKEITDYEATGFLSRTLGKMVENSKRKARLKVLGDEIAEGLSVLGELETKEETARALARPAALAHGLAFAENEARTPPAPPPTEDRGAADSPKTERVPSDDLDKDILDQQLKNLRLAEKRYIARQKKALEPKFYSYAILTDSRGDFHADVRDASRQLVFEFHDGVSLDANEKSLFAAGVMKEKNDMAGLTTYLRKKGLIPKTGTVVPQAEFEERLRQAHNPDPDPGNIPQRS